MSHSNHEETATRDRVDSSRTTWQRIRPWIVPTFGESGWKRKLRNVALRVLFWYAVIVAYLGFVQRDLIYAPGRAEQITAGDAGLPRGYVHAVSTVTDDGIALNGWHVVPVACRTREECDRVLNRSRWLFLFFHGNGGDRRGREFGSRTFTAMDATVFLFDYRGYGENAGRPTEEGLATDARAVWKYATGQRGVPPQRIVIYGESLGGAVAVRLVSELCRAGTPPAGLILGGTFSSMTDTALHHYPFVPAQLILLDRYPSSDAVSSVTCPVLQVHGRHDDIIPVELGRELFRAVPVRSANGIEKVFLEFPNASHNDFPEEAFRSVIRNFLEEIGRAQSEQRPES